MTLLSCDVKVATRLPKYIHARAGIGAEGARRAGPHRLGFSSAVGLLDQMNRSVLLHQQGQAGGDPKWRRSRDHVGFEAAEMEVNIYES